MLLSLADRRLFAPYWSATILDEMERTVSRLASEAGKPHGEAVTAATHRRAEMQQAFRDAEVDGYEALIPAMKNHEKDRHVLAAAVRVRANLIVTANVDDFPESALLPYEIEAKTADEFLLDRLAFDDRLVVEAIRDMTAQKRRPPMTELEMLKRIGKAAPNFAASVLMLLES